MFFNNLAFNQPLNGWKMSKVTTIEGMFQNSNFNQEINNWNISNVTNMSHVFCGNQEFNQPLKDWAKKLTHVKTFNLMFNGAEKFEQNIHDWEINEKTLDGNALDSMLKGTPICKKDITEYFPMNYYSQKHEIVCGK